MAVNLLSWVDFFKRRKPQKAGICENFFSPALHGQPVDLPNGRGDFFLSPFARNNTGDF
jgi:hypothetical protein